MGMHRLLLITCFYIRYCQQSADPFGKVMFTGDGRKFSRRTTRGDSVDLETS